MRANPKKQDQLSRMLSPTLILFLAILGYTACATLPENPIEHFNGTTFFEVLNESAVPCKLFEDLTKVSRMISGATNDTLDVLAPSSLNETVKGEHPWRCP